MLLGFVCRVYLSLADIQLCSLVFLHNLICEETFRVLEICDYFGVVNLVWPTLQLLVRKFFKFIHHAEKAVWINKPIRQAKTLVEDKVDVHVVKDVLLKLGIQFLLQFVFLSYCLKLGQAQLRLVFHAVFDISRCGGWQIESGQGRRRRLKVVCHSQNLHRLSLVRWSTTLKLASQLSALLCNVHFLSSILGFCLVQ